MSDERIVKLRLLRYDQRMITLSAGEDGIHEVWLPEDYDEAEAPDALVWRGRIFLLWQLVNEDANGLDYFEIGFAELSDKDLRKVEYHEGDDNVTMFRKQEKPNGR